jgi:hypothetical protein
LAVGVVCQLVLHQKMVVQVVVAVTALLLAVIRLAEQALQVKATMVETVQEVQVNRLVVAVLVRLDQELKAVLARQVVLLVRL